ETPVQEAPAPSESPSESPSEPKVVTSTAAPADAPVGEIPKVETPKAEPPKTESPKTEPPKVAPPRFGPARGDDEPIRPSGPSLEQLGTWIFAGLGGLAALGTALLFFNYALEEGWFGRIGPGARFALGVAIGVAALVVEGPLGRRGYAVPARAMAGAAIGTLYAAFYASFSRYDLLEQPVAFGAMSLVTVVSMTLAWRRDSQFIASLGLVGGLATPILLSTGQNKAFELFVYLFVLNLAALFPSGRRGWSIIPLGAAFGTALIQLGWAGKYAAYDQLGVGFGAATAFSALYGISTLRVRSDLRPWGTGLGLLAQAVAVLPLCVPMELVTHLNAEATVRDDGGLAWVGALWLVGFSVWAQRVAEDPRLPGAGLAVSVGSILPSVVMAAGYAGALVHAGPQAGSLVWLAPFVALAPPLARSVFWAARSPREDGAELMVAPAIVLGAAFVAVCTTLAGEGATEQLQAFALGLPVLGFVLSTRSPWTAVLGVIAGFLAVEPGLVWAEDQGRAPAVAVAALAAVLLATAWPFIRGAPKDEAAFPLWLAAALAPPLGYIPLQLGFDQSFGDEALGVVPLAMGVLALGSATWLRNNARASLGDRRFSTFVTVATLFACLAVPVQLSDHWLVLGWALECAVLAWLGLRLPGAGVRVFSVALVAGVCGALALDPYVVNLPDRDLVMFFNIGVLTWLVSTVAVGVASRWHSRAGTLLGAPVGPILWFVAVGLAFGTLNVAVAFGFMEDGQPRLFGGTLGQNMILSVCWALFAVALLILGVVSRTRGNRLVAMGFLMLAAGKVFVFDLASLSGIYRVGSFLGAALTLLGSAVLLQRVVLRERDEEVDEKKEERS
ncbi:DUF2339 domain-containing protein, partial [Myxococcota bacterium]|nr:DUF2339 domain-containing protein [Myxococcota bacterium]